MFSPYCLWKTSPSLVHACCRYLTLCSAHWKIKIGNIQWNYAKKSKWTQSKPQTTWQGHGRKITSKRLRNHLKREMLLLFKFIFPPALSLKKIKNKNWSDIPMKFHSLHLIFHFFAAAKHETVTESHFLPRTSCKGSSNLSQTATAPWAVLATPLRTTAFTSNLKMLFSFLLLCVVSWKIFQP